MSIFDCPKCWDTLCTCGWEYRNWGNSEVVDLFENIMKYHNRDTIMKMLNSKKYIEELTEKDKADLKADK